MSQRDVCSHAATTRLFVSRKGVTFSKCILFTFESGDKTCSKIKKPGFY